MKTEVRQPEHKPTKDMVLTLTRQPCPTAAVRINHQKKFMPPVPGHGVTLGFSIVGQDSSLPKSLQSSLTNSLQLTASAGWKSAPHFGL